jgi:uncharacterized membrane-anchored protein YhcB (DUF1043 family)
MAGYKELRDKYEVDMVDEYEEEVDELSKEADELKANLDKAKDELTNKTVLLIRHKIQNAALNSMLKKNIEDYEDVVISYGRDMVQEMGNNGRRMNFAARVLKEEVKRGKAKEPKNNPPIKRRRNDSGLGDDSE